MSRGFIKKTRFLCLQFHFLNITSGESRTKLVYHICFITLALYSYRYLGTDRYLTRLPYWYVRIESSVADRLHFGTDPDPSFFVKIICCVVGTGTYLGENTVKDPDLEKKYLR